MRKTRKRTIVIVIWIGFPVLAFWLAPLPGKTMLEEAFGPTTIKAPSLPGDCVHTDEPPPEALMRFVEQQEGSYQLSLQRVLVCKTKDRLPSDFPARMLDNPGGERWLPLYVGCCSFQLHRYAVVELAAPAEGGSIVVQAALVQGRWSYLRRNLWVQR